MPLHLAQIAQAALAVTLSLSSSLGWSDENDEIVTGCHFSNAEWGYEAIDRCVKDNQANREEVLRYAPQYKAIVERCRRKRELGWSMVKLCVDRDIEAEAELASYPADRHSLIDVCRLELGHRGAVKVKACVDEVLEKK